MVAIKRIRLKETLDIVTFTLWVPSHLYGCAMKAVDGGPISVLVVLQKVVCNLNGELYMVLWPPFASMLGIFVSVLFGARSLIGFYFESFNVAQRRTSLQLRQHLSRAKGCTGLQPSLTSTLYLLWK